MKKSWALIVFLLPVLLFAQGEREPQQGIYQDLSAAEFKEGIESGGVLLDVRTSEEYHSGHIPGAGLIPLQELEKRWTELDPDEPVYVYCRSGSRSRAAVQILQQKGFREIYNLNRGIGEWIASGFPVEE